MGRKRKKILLENIHISDAALKYAIAINGVTKLMMMKVDVLSNLF